MRYSKAVRIYGSVLHSIHVKIAIAELLGAATCAVFKRKSSTAAFSLRQQRARKQKPNPNCLADFVPFSPSNLQIRIPFTKRFAMKHHSSNATGYYVVSRYADIVRLARATDDLSSNLVAILLKAGDGKQAILSKPTLMWGTRRRACSCRSTCAYKAAKSCICRPHTKDVRPSLDGIREHARELLRRLKDDLASNDGVDWMERFALRLPIMVALELVGFNVDDHGRVKKWADHGVALPSGVNTPEEFQEHIRQGLELLEYVRDAYKQMSSGSNFTVHLKGAVTRGDISDEEAISIGFSDLACRERLVREYNGKRSEMLV